MVCRLFPFEITIDHLRGSKMGIVGYILRDPQPAAAKISLHEQIKFAKLDVLKGSAKNNLFNTHKYADFAKPIEANSMDAIISKTNDCGARTVANLRGKKTNSIVR